MKNKIGINNEDELRMIEYKISNFKHRLINENFLFNEETIFSIEYLEKLHRFLFGDIYYDCDCKVKESISETIKIKIQEILNKIHLLVFDMNKEDLANCIYDIWNEQIFYDGNTRTLRAFLKVYCMGYNIEIEHDFDEYIEDDFFISRFMEEIIGKNKKL